MTHTAKALIDIARKARANLVALDGFRRVRGAKVHLQLARKFLYDVGPLGGCGL